MNLIQLFKQMWAENPSTAALASTFLLGSVSSLLLIFKKSITGVIRYILALFMTSFTISSDNKYFYILMNYLKYKGYLKKFRNFKIISAEQIGTQYNSNLTDNDRVMFSLDNATMFVFINKRFFKVSANARTLQNSTLVLTDLTFTTYGRTEKPYEDLMREAIKYDEIYETESNKRDNYIDISNPIIKNITRNHNSMRRKSGYGNEGSFVYKTKSFENVFIKKEDKKKLLDRITRFISSRKFYDKHQIPYHLGLLLYGDPGTGKSSIIKALLSHFNFSNVYYLNSDDIDKISQYNTKMSIVNFNMMIYDYIESVKMNVFKTDYNDWTFDEFRGVSQNSTSYFEKNYFIRYTDNTEIPTEVKIHKDYLKKINCDKNEIKKYYDESFKNIYYNKDPMKNLSVIIIEDIDTNLVQNRNSEIKSDDSFDKLMFEDFKNVVNYEILFHPFMQCFIARNYGEMKNQLDLGDDFVDILFTSHNVETFLETRFYVAIRKNSVIFYNDEKSIQYPIHYVKKVYDESYSPSLLKDSRRAESSSNNDGTLSIILNSLDGLLASEDYIIIATTNHVDSIDPAILRPGRFDFKLEIGSADLEIYKQFCSKYYPKSKISENIDLKYNVTVAQMQEAALSGMKYKEFENYFTIRIDDKN